MSDHEFQLGEPGSLATAMQAFERGDRDVACNLAAKLLERNPQQGLAHYILGASAFDARDLAGAREHAVAAAAMLPDHGQVLCLLGRVRRQLGDAKGARDALAAAAGAGLLEAWLELGDLEHAAGDQGASAAAFESAAKIAPHSAAAHAGLARAYEGRHDLARAGEHAQRSLQYDPENVLARITLAQVWLRTGDFEKAERSATPVAQSATCPNQDRAIAWNLIGKACDRRGDAHMAFLAFAESNRLMLEQYGAVRHMHHPAQPAGVRAMTAFVARLDIRSWRAPPQVDTPAPAFLMGFPRSGTTLLDQILSSHSRIVCLEEKDYLWDAFSEVLRSGDTLERVNAFTGDEISRIRRAYWRRVTDECGPLPGKLLIDRQPLHIVLLPLIKRVFPEAKIIFALRDPRDVVLSCFEQCFEINVAMAQFLELDRAAAYYDAVMQLFALCRDRLDIDIHQVRYRDIVRNAETEARRLTAFLGLPFEAAMLDHRTTALSRDIATASKYQVIEPLYDRSIGRWRRYEAELLPVLPILNAWARHFGYEA